MPDEKGAELRAKLYQCLKIAINRKDLECQTGHLIIELANVMRDPNYYANDTILNVWCDNFIKKNGKEGQEHG